MKRGKWGTITLAAMLSLTLAGCGGGAATSTPAAPAASGAPAKTEGGSKEQIVVGYIGALSGNSAPMGIPGKNGIEIAVESINAAGGINGKQIKFVALDDKADPATSATQAQKLINDDKAVAIIGGPNSGTVKANAQVIAQYGVPELIAIAMEDTLIDKSSPTFKSTFSMTENNSYDIRAVAQYIKSKGYKKIGVIADNTAYGQGGINSIKDIMAKEGVEIGLTIDHAVAAKDLTAQAMKLRDAKVDMVYVYSLGADGALFMKTIKQIGWDVPVVGGRGLNMKSFLDLAGDAANGMILPSVVNTNKPAAQEFVKKYDAKYNDDPAHVYSILGYDAMYMLAEALKKTDGKGGQELITALEGLKDVPTASGGKEHKASFAADKHIAPTENFIVFNVVKDGQFTMLTDDIKSGW